MRAPALGRLFAGARVRILASTILLLAFSTIVSTVALRQILLARTGERVERQLVQEVEEFRRLVEDGRDPRTGEPFGGNVQGIFDVFLQRNVPGQGEAFLTYLRGEPYLVSADRSGRREQINELENLANVTETRRGEMELRGGLTRYLAVPVEVGGESRGAFVVTLALGQERADVEQATQIAAGVSLVVLLLASALAFVTTGRVLAPLRDLTETARGISETDLTKRIDVQGHDEIAELARTFNAMLDRLEAAFATQRDFVSDAGHELRTPITIIRGHLELLGDDPEERRDTVALVVDELDRMSRFVDDLLLLARAESATDFLHLEELDLDSLTEELHAKAGALAARDWQIDSLGVGPLRADRQRITQAVMNLARNAAEHTTDGQLIALGSELHDGTVRMWVRDTGPGVPTADQERIFERFARGSNGRRRSEGAGLGLAITQAIAHAHGGRVELHSNPGAGATFTVVIPSEPPDHEHDEEDPPR
ncbi:MAG: HAMP domain-containing protein [Solirubrobacteraceae bacterium]|nr:HAMP domain-containing protein [Solirubrobacteraceae bacterium]